MSVVVTQLVTDALTKIRVARAGDVLGPDDADLGLRTLNALFDALNAKRRAIYTRTFRTFTLTANHQPHTIGLVANVPDLTVTIGRPVRLVSANLVLANNIRSPLTIVTDADWNAISAGAAAGQAITIKATIPQVLYYEPGWPNGSIFLYPVCSAANGLEILADTLLAAVAATDLLDLPFGYQLWLTLKLAKLLAPDFGQAFSLDNATALREVETDLFSTNDVIPDLVTVDAGMPGAGGGAYDYRVGPLSLTGR